MTLIQLFSFDVVGSAAFKCNSPADQATPCWLSAFQSFFETIPLIFTAEIAHTFFEEEDEMPEVPVWKAIGDELVFIAYPQHDHAVHLLTKAFSRSMRKADEHFKANSGLRIHGSTWSFEEGSRNLAIRFRELESDSTHVMDLIGPDVDLGFRLVTHAKPGRVLVPRCHLTRLNLNDVTVEPIGEATLKGIQSEPYPLLELTC